MICWAASFRASVSVNSCASHTTHRLCAAADGLAELTHQRIAFAIGVFEDTLHTFKSRRDFALMNDADGEFPLDDFTPEENLGHDLFYDRTNACARFCHSSLFRADGTLPMGAAISISVGRAIRSTRFTRCALSQTTTATRSMQRIAIS
jgi:hypothetical protein